MKRAEFFDVVVVGGGPAGAVTAWALARRGVDVAVLERSELPREKVCGDFVEPSGLRILDEMGCLGAVEALDARAITDARIFVQSEVVYHGSVPYYEGRYGMPPYGYIVPRYDLDKLLLDRARAAGATVHERCRATAVRREAGIVRIDYEREKHPLTMTAKLVIGADGTESIVARSTGRFVTDRRYISISQRGYIEGVSVNRGEATVWFDDDIFPGYAWMFPMAGGRANVGVGILSESCQRYGLSVPRMFDGFIAKLREHHSACRRIRLDGRPRGGIVKTYGGIQQNHFDGGLLVGDAGSFVDPVTGEGITQGMESGLIAAQTALEALEEERFDAAFLSRYDRAFRRYFDPSMRYLDLCATLLRNRHFKTLWMRAARHGFREAQADAAFARLSGSSFGGVDVRQRSIIAQMATRLVSHAIEGSVELGLNLLSGRRGAGGFAADVVAYTRGLRDSLVDDPAWHAGWTRDVISKSVGLRRTLFTPVNPRVRGLSNGVVR